VARDEFKQTQDLLEKPENDSKKPRDLAGQSADPKDREIVSLQEDIDRVKKENFKLKSSISPQAAKESFNLVQEILKVIRKMLE